MATKLRKELHREFRIGHEEFILTLEPDYSITFRRKGTKTRFNIPLTGCYNLALINTAIKAYSEKENRYKDRKALGQRTKKPKKPNITNLFHPKYITAIKNIKA